MTKTIRCVAVFVVLLMILNVNIVFAASTALKNQNIASDPEPEDIIIPVLMYHNITENYPKGSEGANITPKLFEKHMEGILERGYTPIFVADYYDSIKRGKTLPENPIIVTFDDGYLSNYEIAFPILKRLNIPATIFVVTSTVGARTENGVSNPHFTWEQAREMQNSGIIDIQSHSHTHVDMSQLSPAQLQEELRISRYLVEKNVGNSCFAFSYPFGKYNETTSSLAKYAGYRMQILVNYAESGQDYLANNTRSGIEHFTRLTISGDMTVENLFEIIEVAVENARRMEIFQNNLNNR